MGTEHSDLALSTSLELGYGNNIATRMPSGACRFLNLDAL
jgi:hypothetical protein